MAAMLSHSEELNANDELWFVSHDDGCPMWDEKFDPGALTSIPPSSYTLEVGTVLVVKSDPSLDDSVKGPNSFKPAPRNYRPSLTAVRGRVGGYDDIDLKTIVAREAGLKPKEDDKKKANGEYVAEDNAVDLIVSQLGCSRARAARALERNRGDTFETILEITGDSDENNLSSPSSSASSSSSSSSSDSKPPHKLTPLELQPFYWIEVLSPCYGWILDCSIIPSEHVHHHPGEPLVRKGDLKESSRWVYKVVCADGAFIRQGLELSSPHRCTLALNSLVEISERRINGQGLSRLRTADGRGYLSEQLNPLSGARGPVVELVSMPMILSYKVVIPEGAVVRRTRELTSPSDRIIPMNETFEVISKNFSDHPASLCVPRLELADGSGWVSQRLCREPPENTIVCEVNSVLLNKNISDVRKEIQLLRLKEEEEIKKQRDEFRAARLKQIKEMQASHAESAQAAIQAANKGKDIKNKGAAASSPSGGSGIEVGERSMSGIVFDDEMSKQMRKMTLNEESSNLVSPDSDILDYACVVCLSSPRTATLVHGETGHVACCLECARVLKARGDPCPVCRMEIQIVIQHYWA